MWTFAWIGLTLGLSIGPVLASPQAGASSAAQATGLGEPVPKRIALDPAEAAPASAGRAAPVAERWRNAAAAVTLADLGLALLRTSPAGAGGEVSARPNEVWSPSALAAVLARLHEGTAGQAMRELAGLVEPSVAPGQFYGRQLPGLLTRLDQSAPEVVRSANRLWVRADLYPVIPPVFMAGAARWPGADVALFPMGSGESARTAINEWVAQRTAQAIRDLMKPGSVTPTTTIALVSALHFRSPWARPFEPSQTVARPFETPDGLRPLATMTAVRAVRRGVMADEGVEVFELPFADQRWALTIVMPLRGQTLSAIERRLSGIEWVSWGERLEEMSCRLHLPRFAAGGVAQSLKPRLAALGVSQVFRAGADFSPMLGSAAAGASVDDLVQAVRIAIDESGGEASAATAATVWAKSMTAAVQDCAVDRAFLFAITHLDSRAPIFMGRISDPSVAGTPR